MDHSPSLGKIQAVILVPTTKVERNSSPMQATKEIDVRKKTIVEKDVMEPTKKAYKDPAACGKSSVNILKEFCVGGDTDDAVLSIYELVGSESEENSLERGIAVVESTCRDALENKVENVDKYIVILTRCVNENKLSTKMVEDEYLVYY